MELEQLLARYLDGGEGTAMDDLVRATRTKLLGVARGIVRADEAEDVVQSAYHSLLRRARRPMEAPVLPWLLTTTIRIAYRRKAKQARQRKLSDHLAQEDRGRDPVAAAISGEESHLVREAIARLPSKYRDAITLFHLEQLSVSEVAALIGAPEPTIKARLQRGRRLLRGRLHPRVGAVIWTVPWWLADRATAAMTIVAGGLFMKSIVAPVAILITLAAGWWVTRSDSNNEPDRRTVARESIPAVPPARKPMPSDRTHGDEDTDARPAPAPASERANPSPEKHSITVQVKQPSGRGVNWAMVRAIQGNTEVYGGTTDYHGQAVLKGLGEGSWKLMVDSLNYHPHRSEFVAQTQDEPVVVRLIPPPERSVRFTLVDTTGRPVTGTWVAIYSDLVGGALVQPDDNGIGTAKVRGELGRISCEMYTFPRTYEPDASTIQLVMPDRFGLTVFDPQGKPMNMARVRVSMPPNPPFTVFTDKSGKAAVPIAAGAEEISLSLKGQQRNERRMIFIDDSLAIHGHWSGPIPESDIEMRTTKARLDRSLRVEVIDFDRAPVKDAAVEVLVEKAWLGRNDGKTNAKGRIHLLGLARRGVELRVNPPKGSALLGTVSWIDAQAESVVITLPRKVMLTGRITRRGNPMPGARISRSEQWSIPVQVEPNGMFRIGVPATEPRPRVRISANGERGTRTWYRELQRDGPNSVDVAKRD